MKKRDILILCIALGAAVILGAVQFLGGAVETGSWGLSFRTPGQPPVGSEDAATLRRYDAYYVGDTSQKVLYLTFDAGYENGNTGKILDVLKKENVPAAFFLVGNYIEKNPDLVRRMAAEGHIVGNHTMHHPDMSIKKTEEKFAPELTGLEELYKNTVGDALPKFYRPPQGVYSKENLEIAQKMGYTTVFWSLAYVDWKNDNQPTREYAMSKILPRLHNGAILLLHSTSATNAEIMQELIAKCKAEGYRFAPLTELRPESGIEN